MRTAIIPAQIITVEDKLAGNLSLSQIIILMIPLFVGTLVYVLFPPKMELTVYKGILTGVVALLFITLSFRVKNKIVFQWLIVLLRYTLRPRYYIFNKNDITGREVDLPVLQTQKETSHAEVKKEIKAKIPLLSIIDMIRFERLITNPNFSLRFKENKKGGLNVAFEQVKE